ncbi:8262_t:CDS:2, partial [Cetraspora pellucida]
MAKLSVKFLALFLVTLALATIISARTHNIKVGPNGNSFSPAKVTVKVGDKLPTVFTALFYQMNLTPTKLRNSEIIKQTAVAGTKGTFVITKNTPSVLGFFCDVGAHCDGGMKGVIE